MVTARIRKGVLQSVPDAIENLAAAVAATDGRRRPLLIDIRLAQPLAADVRREYSGPEVGKSFTALALLIDASPLGRTMGNVYLKLAGLAIPMRLFDDEAEALEWLSGRSRNNPTS